MDGYPASITPRAPYGRHDPARRAAAGDGIDRPWSGETYYERPTVKRSPYRWLVASYLFVGGLAGAAQVIATVADVAGRGRRRDVVRRGRYLALGGALLSPVFLIGDLRTPSRWFNMMRIFRPTSPMSIGSWTLGTFGATSAALAAAEGLREATGARAFGRLARWLGVPAAATGGVMSFYTGTLLAATSVPLWVAGAPLLSALFGTGAASTATAALELMRPRNGERDTAHRLEQLALLSSAAELAVTAAVEARWERRGVTGPLRRPPMALAWRLGFQGLGVVVPLVLHAANLIRGRRRRSHAASLAASIATLVGGFVQRAVLVFAGNESAQRPRDYLKLTQEPVQANGRVALDRAA